MIVAGGANFIQEPGRGEGIVNWNDTLNVLEGDPDAAWISDFALKKPLAYGASVSTGKSLILIGGKNAEGHQSDVIQLTWDRASKMVAKEELPSLPQAIAYSGAAIKGSKLYVRGGAGRR